MSKSGTMKINYRKKPYTVSIDPDSTVGDLKRTVAAAIKLNYNRLELREVGFDQKRKDGGKPAKYDDDRKRLRDYGLKDGSEVDAKDLGAQFSYRGVFVIEYLGPILIIAAFAMRPAFLFGKAGPVDVIGNLTQQKALADVGSADWNHFVQSLAIALWVLHFAKREFETLFIHKFSRATMPLFNLFKNSAYYWGFAAAVGYPLCSADFRAPAKEAVVIGLGLWAASQLTNFLVHYQLSTMRSVEGEKKRSAPGGFLFSLVSCPNYTAEVLGWVGWTILSHVFFGGVFTLVGLAQMTQWALAKHAGYIKDDPAYKRLGRKAIIPFLV